MTPVDAGQLAVGDEADFDVSPLEFRSVEASTSRTQPVAAIPDKLTVQSLMEQIRKLEEKLAHEIASAQELVERVRKEAYREGQKSLEAQNQQKLQEVRQEVARIVENFGAEQERYYIKVEREVVRLALAIATRVLHREAQMDPLLLAGVVRVAIEKLADTSGLVLRTPPGEVMAWQELFRLSGDARVQPEVIGDLSLRPGECILETKLGTVELGVRAQMEEIEKGFFDLLNHRPRGIA